MERTPLDSREHILILIARLDLLIRREVLSWRLTRAARPEDEFRGLTISDEEVNALLQNSASAGRVLAQPLPPSEALDQLDKGIAALDARLAAVAGAHPADENLRFERLCGFFALTPFERQVLVVALAAEIDLKYEKLYAYLQDDVTKKRPTVDLVLRLLCPTFEERLAARRSFEPQAPLQYWELITLHDDPGARRPVLLARYIKLDERVANWLLGSDETDARLVPLLSTRTASLPPNPGPDINARIDEWASHWEQTFSDTQPVLLLHGHYGTGRRAAAARLANGLGCPLLVLDAAALVAQEFTLEQGVRYAEREALLSKALICWDNADALLYADASEVSTRRAFMHALAQGLLPTILLSQKSWEPARELTGRPFLRLEFPDPTYAERRDAWADSLNDSAPSLSETELSALAARFRLTGGQIQDAVARARTLAWSRDPQNGHVELSDIDAACRSQSQQNLGSLARKLVSRYTWDDIVLPHAQASTLHLMCTTVRQRPVVYGEWGFDRKLSLGKGLIALFAGPSGTGKTMAAEIIANELRLDLFKIDLSAVVSKYIGETEKNLERIFAEAERMDAILFFDEADALFGKRSETKDAHDRYANIEIAYLLQRTEEYSGLVILASNIKKNVDEAFVRRLHFMVDFPFPEEPERLEIWRRTFPKQAPCADDLDLPFMARKFKMAGGNIRNVILTAAFLAAEEKARIAMRHLIRGAGYEFQKMGKLVHESDFEQYFDLVKSQ